jgi:ribosomal protein L16 Arg81 hydroxylase
LTHSTERGPAPRSALSRLITVDDHRFAEEFWGRAPLFSAAADLAADFSDLFSSDAVDELVAERAVRTPFVRMAKEGSVLPPARYTASGGFGAEVSDQLDPARVLHELGQGSTLVLQGLHRTWSPLAGFTRGLVDELGHPAQVNAYITPASSRGFDPHYDVHDVFVLQIAGQKHWTIHAPVHVDPLRDQPWSDRSDAVAARATEPPVIDRVFSPGDVLYLPRGWIHSATALGGTSIHLTIGVAALTRHDVVERLVAAASGHEGLRTSLPVAFDRLDPDALRAIVEETVESLTEHLSRGVDLDRDVAAPLRRRVPRITRPAPVRPLATLDAVADLAAGTPVRWRDGLRAEIVRRGGSTSIVLDGKSVSLPEEADAALRSLHARLPATAGVLPGLDEGSSLVVSRRLLREGVLVLA